MKILYIYRSPQMGFSIEKVFRPIEKEMKKYNDVESISFYKGNYNIISLIKNIFLVKKYLKKRRFDIIHITGSEHYLLPFLFKYKTIVTVHDLGFYTNHKRSIRRLWKKILWINTLHYAKYVTFISEFSQKEALKLVQLHKSSVIHNPISKDFQPFSKKFNSINPCILHIGTMPNKNLYNTIEALKGFPCKLRIIGKLSEEEKEHLQRNHINYSNAYNLSDQEIIQEYQQCDIVNFPSLYEGFGMPILESQSIGRVVITSNLSPMKDIANDSAVLVDPTNINSIREGYKKAIKQYEKYIEKGFENVKRFQLEQITLKYNQIYHSLIQE